MASRLFQRFISRTAWLAFIFLFLILLFNWSVSKDKIRIYDKNPILNQNNFHAAASISHANYNEKSIYEIDENKTYNELIHKFNDWYIKTNFTKENLPKVHLVPEETSQEKTDKNEPLKLLVETAHNTDEEADYNDKLDAGREQEKQFHYEDHVNMENVDHDSKEIFKDDESQIDDTDYDEKLEEETEKKIPLHSDNQKHLEVIENNDTDFEQDENGKDYEDKLEAEREKEKQFHYEDNESVLRDENGKVTESKGNYKDAFVDDALEIKETFKPLYNNTSSEVKVRNTNSTVILDLERIPFLPNYRNPCWLEPLPLKNPYMTNRYGGKKNGYMSNLTPAWERLYSRYKSKESVERIRCLPYFFIGGFPKCGTTDIYDKLILHPMIEGCLFKEPHYWTRWRFWPDKCFYNEFLCADGEKCIPKYFQCNGRKQCQDGSDEWSCEPPHNCSISNGGCSHTCTMLPAGVPQCSCPRNYQLQPDKKTCVGGATLTDYTDLFDVAAEEINRFTLMKDFGRFHPKITGEATPATFWDNHRWHDEPSNDNNTAEPVTHISNVITHLLPNVKNIVMIRNPTDRLFSDLVYFRPYSTPQYFHEKVVEGINWFNNCTSHKSLRSCVYEPVSGTRPPEGRYWQPVERIRIGMYSEYLKDWLKTVPRKQIKVVRLEDYSAERATVLQDVISFLELEPMPSDYLYKWGLTGYKNSGSAKYAKIGQMLNETRTLLDDFYRPFNKQLAILLNDDKYMYIE